MGRGRNWTWLTVAFLTELAAPAALAVAGWSLPDRTAVRAVLAVGLPLVAAVLWGLFASPGASGGGPAPRVTVKAAVYGAAVLALLLTGHPVLGTVLGAAALLSSVLSTPPE